MAGRVPLRTPHSSNLRHYGDLRITTNALSVAAETRFIANDVAGYLSGVAVVRLRPGYGCNATRRMRNARATRREPNGHRRQVHRSMIFPRLTTTFQRT